MTRQVISNSSLSLAQAPHFPLLLNSTTLLVRSTNDPLALVNTVRRQIHSVDPDLPLATVATMEARIDDSLKPQRFNTFLMGSFAALALFLAVIGLYGIMSYTVVQRRHEIGVRMALVAQSRNVIFLVLKQGLRLTLLGVAIGIAGAIGLTRILDTFSLRHKPDRPGDICQCGGIADERRVDRVLYSRTTSNES
jgi:putative ABC transport system permease protein